MRQRSRAFLLALTSVAVATAAAAQSLGGKPPMDVNVVNTPGVEVVNEPTVSLAPGSFVEVDGAVEVVNSEENPVPVRVVPADERPFQVRLVHTWADGQFGSSASFVVPSDGRLILEYVSAAGDLQHGQSLRRATVAVSVDGLVVAHFLPIGNGPEPSFTVAQALRLTADPGTTVFLNLVRSDGTSTANGVSAIAGRIVPIP